MSHFNVLVIGEDVEGQMAPYHEFECTGHEDEYVQDIDVTDKMRDEYESSMETVCVSMTGEVLPSYDDRFYREITQEDLDRIDHKGKELMGSGIKDGFTWTSRDWGDGRGHRSKTHYVPDGWTKETRHAKERMTFLEFLTHWEGYSALEFGADKTEEHKYGYAELGPDGEVVKVIRRTNPNSHWDWWVIGGRWRDWLILKDDYDKSQVLRGELSVFDKIKQEDGEKIERPKDRCDSALFKDIDWQARIDEAVERTTEFYEAYQDIIEAYEGEWPNWSALCDRIDAKEITVQEARNLYHDHPLVMAIHERDKELGQFTWGNHEERFCNGDLQAMLTRAKLDVNTTFALVKDGQWHQKGQMLMFASVAEEKTSRSWAEEFNALLEDVDPDTRITIVDCHV